LNRSTKELKGKRKGNYRGQGEGKNQTTHGRRRKREKKRMQPESVFYNTVKGAMQSTKGATTGL